MPVELLLLVDEQDCAYFYYKNNLNVTFWNILSKLSNKILRNLTDCPIYSNDEISFV